MNYKTSTIVLFLALVAMVIYHFSTIENGITKTEEQEETQEVKEVDYTKSHLDKELSKHFADKLANGVDPELGKFITKADATDKIKRIKQHRSNYPPRNPNIHDDYGYVFGLNKVRALVSKIDSINDAIDTVNLTGIRVYRTISKIKNKEHSDVFMIAVTKDNKDFPDLGNTDIPFLDEDPILNVSTPCPELCD